MSIRSEAPPKLHTFITDNLHELIARARARAAQRRSPRSSVSDVGNGVRLLLVQIATLLEQSGQPISPDAARAHLASSADARGKVLLADGLSIGQVVHGYGDVCQVVTELATERNVQISAADFRAFNACLDEAIAHAVTEYASVSERVLSAQGAEKLGHLSRELRKVLAVAMLSFDAIKRGVAGVGGSVSNMHTRSLMRLGELIESTLAPGQEGHSTQRELVSVAELVEEAEIAAMFQAQASELDLLVSPVPADVAVSIDRQMMLGALARLLQNAVQFTRARSLISLHTRASATQVHIDVEDECGGLPKEEAEALLRTFDPKDQDRSGAHLGLLAVRQAVEASGGALTLANIPSVGCRFTIEIPRAQTRAQTSSQMGSQMKKELR